MKKSIIAAALFMVFCVNVMADELYLKSGEIVDNEIIKITEQGYIVKDGSKWREIPKDEISFVKDKKSDNENENVNVKKFTPEVIVKTGFYFTGKITSYDHNNGNASYDLSNSCFLGADFYVPVSRVIFLGAGAKANLNSTLQSGYGYFLSVPCFVSVKLQNQLNEKVKIYSSFNLGTSFISATGEFMADNGERYDSVNHTMNKEHGYLIQPYYGLNLGVDIDRIIIELGFSYENYATDGGNTFFPDNMNITRTSLAIGYRI